MPRLISAPFLRSARPLHAALITALLLASAPALAQVGTSQTVKTDLGPVQLTVIAAGLENPWGIAFLPDGSALVTERPGRLRLIDRSGKVSAPLAGVPKVDAINQGGLLDVALDPDFARNKRIYLSFAEVRGDGLNGTSVARATLGDKGLSDVVVIFRQQPAMSGGHHFGSRLVFGA